MSLTTKEMLKLMRDDFLLILNTQHDEIKKLNNYVRAQTDNLTKIEQRINKLERQLLLTQESTGVF